MQDNFKIILKFRRLLAFTRKGENSSHPINQSPSEMLTSNRVDLLGASISPKYWYFLNFFFKEKTCLVGLKPLINIQVTWFPPKSESLRRF